MLVDKLPRGQASVETLLLLAAILVIAASLQFMGRSSNEGTVALSAARAGAENALNKLALENGVEMNISNWRFKGDNIFLQISVYGSPPPDNQKIKSAVEESAKTHIRRSVGSDYDVTVNIERVKK